MQLIQLLSQSLDGGCTCFTDSFVVRTTLVSRLTKIVQPVYQSNLRLFQGSIRRLEFFFKIAVLLFAIGNTMPCFL